jgi:universal stress protein A
MSPATVLCPVDFSNASRGALRYALAIAEHFGARLTLMTVSDPLLAEAVELKTGASWLAETADRDLQRVLELTSGGRTLPIEVSCKVVIGKPASEILKEAAVEEADLIVMSSRGNSGVRKLFFGATTERVLRETTVPVLVTPATDPGPKTLDDLRSRLHHVLAPIDYMGATSHQLGVARAIANGLGTTLILAHVVEPLWFPTAVQPKLATTDNERRHRAEQFLIDAAKPSAPERRVELLTAFGDPAEEIAKIAQDRGVGVIVMGLHASPRSGPRMGSVTYRVLCLAQTLVLALPPTAFAAARTASQTAGAVNAKP